MINYRQRLSTHHPLHLYVLFPYFFYVMRVLRKIQIRFILVFGFRWPENDFVVDRDPPANQSLHDNVKRNFVVFRGENHVRMWRYFPYGRNTSVIHKTKHLVQVVVRRNPYVSVGPLVNGSLSRPKDKHAEFGKYSGRRLGKHH